MELIAIFALFLGLLIIRVPVAFAMLAIAAAYLAYNGIPLSLLAQKVSGGVDSFTLLAVPLFLAAGCLMNTMGITDRIFAFAGALVRHLPGGLGHVNVVASVIFAGMSGSAVADAGGLGIVEIRAMRNAGYRDGFSAAVTAASALIGPIIPPSIIMIVYAFVTDVSIGRLFLAGIVPGIIMAVTLMALIAVLAKTGRENCPVIPRADLSEVISTLKGAILPIFAPIILVGGILSGIFTPTEAGVVAVIYVLLLGIVLLNFNVAHIVSALTEAARATAATLFIIASAAIFTWIVATTNLPRLAGEFITGTVSSQLGILLFIVAIVLVLGMVMEAIPVLVVFGPIFLEISGVAGIDPIHLGIVFIMTMMIGGITPPVGIVLFVVMAIAKVSLPVFVRSVFPFYIAILLVIGLLILVPQLSLWLPNLVFGG